MHKAFSAMIAGAAVVMAGCGGGGGSNLDQPANPLAGSFGGKGTESGSTDGQFAKIGVASDGTLCGTIYDHDAKTRATLGAVVSATGVVSQGSILYTDSKGNQAGSGALSGQITGLNGSSGAAGVSASLVATIQSSTLTYTFPTLKAPVRFVKRRKKKQASSSQGNGG